MTFLSSLVSPLNAGIYQRFQYSPAQGANTVSGSDVNGNVLNYLPNYVQVFKNGLMLPNTDVVAANGNGLGFTTGFNSGDTVDVVALSTMSVAAAILYDRKQIATANQSAQVLANIRQNVNYSISASVASNILTVTVTDFNGNNPTGSTPMYFYYRNATATSGVSGVNSQTSALSISTVVGATQGTAANVPFRLWLVVFNNSGTNVLALWQSVTGGAAPTGIASLNDAALASATAMSASATAAGTFYCPAGTTITSMPFKILGYLDFASGMATPGTYASGPTTIQLFEPGTKKPGDLVQTVFTPGSTTFSTSSTSYVATNVAGSITPTSAVNAVRVVADSYGRMTAGGGGMGARIQRGSTVVSPYKYMRDDADSTGVNSWWPTTLLGWDAPGVTTSVTYTVYITADAAGHTIEFPDGALSGNSWSVEMKEIMV